MSKELAGKTVLLGVAGSIAAFKAVELASALVQEGAEVIVLMTRSATKFITPLSFEAITRRPVITSLWEGRYSEIAESRHVSLAERAHLLLIAPATAHVIARLAHGLCDDILTCTALAARAPVLLAPAMNDSMYSHAATQRNIAILRERGCHFVGPEEGRLASGKMGLGRLAAISAIMGAVREALKNSGAPQGSS
jgi:phosphopantothenoylcysteine decarboxylase/phosphopantothenate--cysteine ligase